MIWNPITHLSVGAIIFILMSGTSLPFLLQCYELYHLSDRVIMVPNCTTIPIDQYKSYEADNDNGVIFLYKRKAYLQTEVLP